MRKITNRKAVSPVIATVILVAVAITVSVAVSYWMSGISAQYTQFEKVEIQTGYSTRVTASPTGWNAILELKNSGSATATITTVFVNEMPLDSGSYDNSSIVDGYITTSIPDAGLTLTSGNSSYVYIYISDTFGELSSGTTVDIKLHSGNGNDYIKLIKLV